MALYEWGLTPEYINSHWTEEKFQLMLDSRRLRCEAMRPRSQEQAARPEGSNMDLKDFLLKHGKKHKIEHRIT